MTYHNAFTVASAVNKAPVSSINLISTGINGSDEISYVNGERYLREVMGLLALSIAASQWLRYGR